MTSTSHDVDNDDDDDGDDGVITPIPLVKT